MQNARGPRWWLLLLLVPLLAGLFYLESRLSLPPTIRHITQVGVIVLIFGLVYQWVNANTAGLLRSTDGPHAQDTGRSGPKEVGAPGDQEGQAE
jgi:hypothetical protein